MDHVVEGLFMKPLLTLALVILVILTIYLYRIVPWLRLVLRKPDVVFIIGCSKEVLQKLKAMLKGYELHVVTDIDDFYPYHKRLCLFIIELDESKSYPLNIYDIFKKETKEKKRAPVLFVGQEVNELQLKQWKYRGHDFVHVEELDSNEDLFMDKMEKLIGKRRPALLPKKGTTFLGKYRVTKELDRDSVYCKFAGTATGNNIPVDLYFLPSEYWAEEIKQRLRKIVDASELEDFPLYTVLESQNDSHSRCFVLHNYEGVTLEDFVRKKGNLNLLEAKIILLQLAKGIQACHSIELYHGNIVPENVFIPYERGTKTPDISAIKLYGVEKWPRYKKLAGAKMINTSRIAKNSLELAEYFPPEYLKDKPSKRYDLFQLGALIVFILRGRIPYMQTGKHQLNTTQDVPELSISAIENANSEEQLEKVANYFMGVDGEKQ